MPYAPQTGAIATPIGTVVVSAEQGRLTGVRIEADARPHSSEDPGITEALAQLADYFAGTRTAFDLPLAPAATTRGAALRAGMADIGYGETLTYGALSARIASSPRAIGQACAKNPFPIVIPCHRVLAATGLGQYSAGDGAPTKQWLLDFERTHGDTA